MGDPESRGSYLKKHTTFLVTLEPLQSRARRRFSDFEWLHSVLRARYVGMLVPSLPEKTVTLKSDAAFIQSRVRGLSLFLECVMQSPYLRSDASVSSFFTATDEKEWETAKKVRRSRVYVWVGATEARRKERADHKVRVMDIAWLVGDSSDGECRLGPLALAHAHHSDTSDEQLRRVRFASVCAYFELMLKHGANFGNCGSTVNMCCADEKRHLAAFKKQLDVLERTLVDISGCTKVGVTLASRMVV